MLIAIPTIRCYLDITFTNYKKMQRNFEYLSINIIVSLEINLRQKVSTRVNKKLDNNF